MVPELRPLSTQVEIARRCLKMGGPLAVKHWDPKEQGVSMFNIGRDGCSKFSLQPRLHVPSFE